MTARFSVRHLHVSFLNSNQSAVVISCIKRKHSAYRRSLDLPVFCWQIVWQMRD
jgi:hypothetical protein